jgi:hypothetical protein
LKTSDVEIDGLIGQNGSDAPVEYAAHARHAHRPTWVHPKAMRGLLEFRATERRDCCRCRDRPGTTARISENV